MYVLMHKNIPCATCYFNDGFFERFKEILNDEVFVLFKGEERVGLAVADHDRFELYCSDDAVGQAFLNNIPAVWFGELVCAGYYKF